MSALQVSHVSQQLQAQAVTPHLETVEQSVSSLTATMSNYTYEPHSLKNQVATGRGNDLPKKPSIKKLIQDKIRQTHRETEKSYMEASKYKGRKFWRYLKKLIRQEKTAQRCEVEIWQHLPNRVRLRVESWNSLIISKLTICLSV